MQKVQYIIVIGNIDIQRWTSDVDLATNLLFTLGLPPTRDVETMKQPWLTARKLFTLTKAIAKRTVEWGTAPA